MITETLTKEVTTAQVVSDEGTLARAYNEEPDGGYMLAKKMGDGTLRTYPVRVLLAPPSGGANA